MRPGASPEKRTLPGAPPMVTVGCAGVVRGGLEGLASPEGGIAETVPRPKQNIEMVSVRFAGSAASATVAVPARRMAPWPEHCWLVLRRAGAPSARFTTTGL